MNRFNPGWLTAILVASTCLPGCATIFYDRTKTGTFVGRLDVEWVEPNLFIYRPNDKDPLVFTTSEGLKIQPRTMYTDGGSIPRLFWSTPMLGPWDFAPGYIIHDWLFEQHHCQEAGWDKVDFPHSAQILAEAIKTQMVKSDTQEATVVWAIYEAVRSPVAEKLWDGGPCNKPPAGAPIPLTPEGKPKLAVKIMTISFP